MVEIKNPCEGCDIEFRHCPLQPNACKKFKIYQAILAHHKAVIEWLNGECEEHPYKKCDSCIAWDCCSDCADKGNIYHEHRYLCPACMKEFMESK